MSDRLDTLAEVRRKVEKHFAPLRDRLLPETVSAFRSMKDIAGPMDETFNLGLRVTEMMGGLAAYKKVMAILDELEKQET